jgi:diguanylate cyclase (GGDEF)-like protein/PAS domain S-box-containing protein
MADTAAADARAEIVRLNKVVRALMDRAERSTSLQGSEFSLFQGAVMLEDQVRSRTAQLEAALRDNEKANRALRESEARFRGLVSQTLVGIVIIEDGRFSYANAKFEAIFGYGADEVRTLGPLDMATPEDRPRLAAYIRQRLGRETDRPAYVFQGLRKDGRVIDVECHGSAMDVGGQRALIALVMDVTERVRAERELRLMHDRLRDQSTHDALTGLHNRRYLEESFARELIAAVRHRHPVSVIMGDIDHFKAVNDHHGHQAGDEVLRAFGQLIRRHARGSDICCRYGGEEFLLVLPRMARADAMRRAEQLRAELAAAAVRCGAATIFVTASFGVASFPDNGDTAERLIAAADGAMYEAKAGGRNRVNVSRGPHTAAVPQG